MLKFRCNRLPVLCLAALVSACGNKGDLFLPEQADTDADLLRELAPQDENTDALPVDQQTIRPQVDTDLSREAERARKRLQQTD